jgi:DNA-directed RNA polymerase subunit M/transcription elongation factor TFIIS
MTVARLLNTWLLPASPVQSLLELHPGEARMDREAWKSHTCPKCGSGDYQFRNRKRIAADAERLAAWETKYRCKACGHEWKEQVTG